MKTIVYFIRHAESDYAVHDDLNRPLTTKGEKDALNVADYLEAKGIEAVLSSPYKRAIDTVKPFADRVNLNIELVHDFRERKVDNCWIDDFNQFTKNQWEDFNYKLSNGECLKEVQQRNIKALKEILSRYKGKNIVIGTHGTALSTIINYYDSSYGYKEFNEIRMLMPWIVKFTFEEDRCINIEKINILKRGKYDI